MRNTPVETIEYKGFKIEIYSDDDATDPREWDNLGIMACFHNQYTLGDYKLVKDEYSGLRSNNFSGWQEMSEYIIKELNAYVILPLYMYDHSGITISTGKFSCPWDSGQIGFIFVTKEAVKKEWGKLGRWTRRKVTRMLKNEVKTYDDFVTGAVYGYQIKDKDGEELDGPDIMDSCWGFYGYKYEENGLLEDARSNIDWIIKNRANRARSQKALAKSKIVKYGVEENSVMYD